MMTTEKDQEYYLKSKKELNFYLIIWYFIKKIRGIEQLRIKPLETEAIDSFSTKLRQEVEVMIMHIVMMLILKFLL